MVTATERFLTFAEAAEVLQICQNSVYVLSRDGRLPFVMIGGRRRYVLSQILETLARQPVSQSTISVICRRSAVRLFPME
jgi:excisionase family DNA binding protein